MEMENKSIKADKTKESKTVCSIEDKDKSMGFQSKDPIIAIPVQEKIAKQMEATQVGVEHPTTYLETLSHLLKGNVGSGIFAMGDAFKNAGIAMAPWLILVLGVICVHCQHLLLNCSNKLKQQLNLDVRPDFAGTVELCFATGPERLQKYAPAIRRVVNVFLCITQLGFCCVYFVFISTNIKQVLDYYEMVIDVHVHMLIILCPILLSCMVRNLKYLAPLSTIANFLMLTGIIITLYYACYDLEPLSSLTIVASISQYPLFFGTALFAFEGIGLVLPLQSEMKEPEQFCTTFGVLNVGMTTVTFLYLIVGLLSYLKYGEDILGSVTLNLPQGDFMAQLVKVIISIAIMMTYPLQFYVAAEIMWNSFRKKYEYYLGSGEDEYFLTIDQAEYLFRAVLAISTFIFAEVIPYLDLFISFVGSVAAVTLSVVFPPVCKLVSIASEEDVSYLEYAKDWFLLAFGIFAFLTGTTKCISQIAEHYQDETDRQLRLISTFSFVNDSDLNSRRFFIDK